jgi:amino acid adenylation domain-containing protein
VSTTQDTSVPLAGSRDHRNDTGYPLALAQERIWVSEQLADSGSLYGSPVVFALRGELDLELLEAGLTRIVERHEVLRSAVSDASGSARLVTLPARPVRLEPMDVASEQTMAGLVDAATAVPFDLAEGPLVRFGLYRLGPSEHRLLVDVHHLSFDALSAGVLVRELAELYAAGVQGREARLPELPFSYGRHAVAQRRSLAEGLLESHIDYWCDQLKGAPFTLDLPTDYPRPSRMSFRGASHGFTLPAPLRTEIAAAARRWSVTPFVVMLAGWAAVLARYSHQEELLVGTPVAGRTEPGTEDMIGMFVNTLALRIRPEHGQSFRGLIDQARRSLFEGLAHQDAPIEKLVERLRPPRDPGRSPLFQTLFTYDEALEESVHAGGLTIEDAAPPARATAKLDLSIEVVEREGRLEAEIEYATDLFKPEMIRRIAGHYISFLGNAVRSPNRPLVEIPLLTENERQMLTGQWSGGGTHFKPAVLPALFEAQVERTPEAVAVSCGESRWSYRELNERANRLARDLIGRGVGTEDVVAVALTSSPLLALAILAVGKAGAAFLPLDPSYPAQRLDHIISDARPVLLLTDTGGAEARSWPGPILVLEERTTGRESGLDASNPAAADRPRPLAPAHPAYVVYTSGSTGAPKGVSVTHAGVAGLAGAQIEAFGVRPDSRVLQFASPSFDASVSELCMALLSGARLVFVPGLRDFVGGSLEEVLIREAVTHVTLPPSVLASLSADGPLPADLTVVVAGESLGAELAGRWAARCRLFNAYGPTEATVCATLAGPSAGDEPPPIGRPIADTRVFVLDDDLQPAPVGVVGDLYLSGTALARGYLGMPDRTAGSFVAAPFGPPGTRMYRTGDRVRWRDDANLEFIGREDDQVKVNGFRIELGEIENVIASHPGVRQAAVMVREDRPGLRRIVAYAVGAALDEEIAAHAASRLPGYMLPAALVRLAALPLTANGKVDRRNLPAPERPAPGTGRGPATAREQQLCELFGEVLGIEGIGVDESFFALGGHSLLAVRLLSRIRSVFGVEIGIRALFEAPTAALLAEQFDTGRIAVTTRPALVPMPR